MLDVHGISHSYGRHEALHDVSVRLRAGEVLGVAGVSGNGQQELLAVRTDGYCIINVLRLPKPQFRFTDRATYLS